MILDCVTARLKWPALRRGRRLAKIKMCLAGTTYEFRDTL